MSRQHVYTKKFYSAKEKWSYKIASKGGGGTGEYYIQWGNPGSEEVLMSHTLSPNQVLATNFDTYVFIGYDLCKDQETRKGPWERK